MSDSTHFISDLHLDDQHPALTRAFERYCMGPATEAGQLFILGDLFEAWLGDDDDSETAERVRCALSSLSKAGTDISVLGGNRDFLIGQRFADDIGGQLLDEQAIIDLHGQRALLLHGDSLCTRDTAYMQWRQQCRSEAWQTQFLGMDIETRRQAVKAYRQQSTEANSNKAEDIMDVTPDEVSRVLSEAGSQLMIHGHTHRPAIHRLQVNGQPAKRIVLADWDSDINWLSWNASGFQLNFEPV